MRFRDESKTLIDSLPVRFCGSEEEGTELDTESKYDGDA